MDLALEIAAREYLDSDNKTYSDKQVDHAAHETAESNSREVA
ncbi:MAG: hypothetical protein AAF662_06550 [Pseudomonadota bacterium]